MIDDNTLQRLLRGEVHKLNHDLAEPVPLRAVRDLDAPQSPTKGGGVHVFDRDALDRFHAALSPLARVTVRVPLRFYVPHDLRGEVYLAEPDAIEAATQLGATKTQPRDGKLWMSQALAQAFSSRYRTLVQFVRQ